MIPIGFEPTLFRTRALIWRLRPLGHGITKLFCLYSLSNVRVFNYIFTYHCNNCINNTIEYTSYNNS